MIKSFANMIISFMHQAIKLEQNFILEIIQAINFKWTNIALLQAIKLRQVIIVLLQVIKLRQVIIVLLQVIIILFQIIELKQVIKLLQATIVLLQAIKPKQAIMLLQAIKVRQVLVKLPFMALIINTKLIQKPSILEVELLDIYMMVNYMPSEILTY